MVLWREMRDAASASNRGLHEVGPQLDPPSTGGQSGQRKKHHPEMLSVFLALPFEEKSISIEKVPEEGICLLILSQKLNL